jgi:polysaccharide export outer membrane protein
MRGYLVLLVVLLLTACGPGGAWVWVQDLPKQPSTRDVDGYRLAIGDTVSVRVFGQENLSTKSRVRPDGKMAIPIVGDVQFRGRKPSEISAELEAEMKAYVVTPHVTVTVEESQAFTVTVIGEVVRPATVTVDPSAGVLQALAAAGGLSEFADRDRIFVLRKLDGRPTLRVRFTFDELKQADPASVGFTLSPGDVVVVD